MGRNFYLFGKDKLELDNTGYILMIVESVYRFGPGYDISPDGILIAEYELQEDKIFELRLAGKLSVRNHRGESVSVPELYLEYFKRGEQKLLHFESLPVLKLVDTTNPMNFHGVYYRIKDAEAEIGRLQHSFKTKHTQ